MSGAAKTDCNNLADHQLHICQLRKQGRQKEVADLMEDPGHTCHNCNAVAKNSENLCNPSPFLKI